MKTFKDLVFKKKDEHNMHASIVFENGESVSVLYGKGAFCDENTYECWYSNEGEHFGFETIDKSSVPETPIMNWAMLRKAHQFKLYLGWRLKFISKKGGFDLLVFNLPTGAVWIAITGIGCWFRSKIVRLNILIAGWNAITGTRCWSWTNFSCYSST